MMNGEGVIGGWLLLGGGALVTLRVFGMSFVMHVHGV